MKKMIKTKTTRNSSADEI